MASKYQTKHVARLRVAWTNLGIRAVNIDFPEFIPHPFCRNAHWQTVLSIYVPTKHKLSSGERRDIKTEDGDTIAVRENTPENWKPGGRVVVMIHGLCGSHKSQYMMRVSAKLIDLGFKTIRIDMRGFGDSQSVSRGHMHAGRSDDVKNVIEETCSRFPNSSISVIGFSLGGNITLKLLCDYGKSAPEQLDSAVVVAPPIDLLRCTLNLRHGLNRFYDSYFAKLLAKAVKARRKSGRPFDDLPVQKFPKQLYQFDDQYTAPASGFLDAEDYYAKCSTHRRLDQVSVPTLMLIAEDDPIVPFGMYDAVDFSPITKWVAKGGGHLGFFAKKSKDPDRRWMDWRVVEWVREADRISRESSELRG